MNSDRAGQPAPPDPRGAGGPMPPYLCERSAPLPVGWVRGDPTSIDVDHPRLQVAYDPRRHTVACLPVAATAEVRRRLSAAGFAPLPAFGADSGVQIFVRDRAASQQRRPAPSSPGRSR